ncbi:hypothetical protein JCM13304A_12680 [Desulfothermus okinawensis JCM 13304]
MDANFFRFIIRDGYNLLKSARIEKVYNPISRVWTFKLSSKTHLIFFFDAKNNFLFFSKNKPENPLKPSPKVGWWRKRTQNHVISHVSVDWPNRRISLKIEKIGIAPQWIFFDLKDGLELMSSDPVGQINVTWPTLDEVLSSREIYKKYPNITSPIRYSLLNLRSDSEREFWYSKLVSGDIEKFYVYENPCTEEIILSLWPVSNLRDNRETVFESALDAAEYYGWSILNRLIKKGTNEGKRTKRLKKRLIKEREKLDKWISLESHANIIKDNLHKIDPNVHCSSLELGQDNGTRVKIELDPSLSVLENMNLMFQRAKKGKRGLVSLQKREERLLSLKDSQGGIKFVWSEKSGLKKTKEIPSRFANLKVRVYKSSDGILIVRGKNKVANHKLLSFGARSHDIWFHAQGGPGAHVIVIRDNPKKEVPITTLEQAAMLAGLASYQRDSDYAEVIGTEVRYVKKKKNMALGEVEVTKVLYSFRIKIDPLIEDRLRIY